MEISLISEENCEACRRVEKSLKKIAGRLEGISWSIINIEDYKGKNISAVPALVIDGELFSYGDIDEDRLLSYIKK